MSKLMLFVFSFFMIFSLAAETASAQYCWVATGPTWEVFTDGECATIGCRLTPRTSANCDEPSEVGNRSGGCCGGGPARGTWYTCRNTGCPSPTPTPVPPTCSMVPEPTMSAFPITQSVYNTLDDCNTSGYPSCTGTESCIHKPAVSAACLIPSGSPCYRGNVYTCTCSPTTPTPTVAGSQTRVVECRDSLGFTIPDSFCTGPRPPDTQVCGAPPTTPPPTTPPPSPGDCWLWTSGTFASDVNNTDEFGPNYESLINDVSQTWCLAYLPPPLSSVCDSCCGGSNIVPVGNHANLNTVMERSIRSSFQSFAMGPDTRVEFFTGPNFTGSSQVFQANGTTGLAVYDNSATTDPASRDPSYNKTFSPASLEAMFPRGSSARQLHDVMRFASGSVRVSCTGGPTPTLPLGCSLPNGTTCHGNPGGGWRTGDLQDDSTVCTARGLDWDATSAHNCSTICPTKVCCVRPSSPATFTPPACPGI